MGFPNCRLSFEYLTHASMHPCIMPTQPDATPYLPLSRALMATLKPSPTLPSTASFGILQSSNISSAVLEALSPSLPFISFVEKPGPPFSTIKAVIPLCPFVLSVIAKIHKVFLFLFFSPPVQHGKPYN